MKNVTKSFVAIALGAAIAAPAVAAGGLTAEQIAEERANLHSQGSLPFVHSAEFYGSGTSDVIITMEQQDELDNLHADGSLPFIHSPVLYGAGVSASEVVMSADKEEGRVASDFARYQEWAGS